MKMFIHLLSSLNIAVSPDPLGGFIATVEGLPGCGSQGDTVDEVLINLDDAIMTALDVLREDDPARLQRLCGTVTQTQTSGGARQG